MADLVALGNGHLLGNSDYKSNRIEWLYVCAAREWDKSGGIALTKHAKGIKSACRQGTWMGRIKRQDRILAEQGG